MEIKVHNLQRKINLNSRQIRTIARKILDHQNISNAELSIVIVTHQRIRALNQIYLKRNYATDVLAFDQKETPPRKKSLKGDVIISIDAALKNSKQFKNSLSEELILYIIHGILHLLGYDDHKPSDIRQIRKKEAELLDCLRNATKKIIP